MRNKNSGWKFGVLCLSHKVGPSVRSLRLLSAVFFISVLSITDAIAASQLMITPTRIVFSDKTRSASVTIINTGDSPGTYRVSLVNKRMTVDGAFEDVKEARPGELFSDKMIRYSPRQVVLEPGKSQVVRLGLRKPSGLKAGEYRSHMLVRAIPEVNENVEANVQPSTGVTIKLQAIVGISIPMIVRHGKTEAGVSFVSVKYLPGQSGKDRSYIMLELKRSGNRSVYGDLLAEFIASNGDRTVISQVGGVAIYTPGAMRRIKLPVNIPAGLELTKGAIQVLYRSPVDKGGRVLAQKQIKVP